MSSMPCACQRSQLSVQAFCAQPKLQCRGVNRSHGVKSAYLGQRLLSQRLGEEPYDCTLLPCSCVPTSKAHLQAKAQRYVETWKTGASSEERYCRLALKQAHCAVVTADMTACLTDDNISCFWGWSTRSNSCWSSCAGGVWTKRACRSKSVMQLHASCP